jgi:hypothetical protein
VGGRGWSIRWDVFYACDGGFFVGARHCGLVVELNWIDAKTSDERGGEEVVWGYVKMIRVDGPWVNM